ncbi:MAG TPA: hypothetical protein V6D28_27420 [Leptolyngbyaceae cyanobacterium]
MNSRLLPFLLLLSISCVACQSSQGTSNSRTSTTTTTQSGTSAQQIVTNSLPPTQTYDLQVNKDSIVARLTQVSFADDSIIVTMAITNGSNNAIQLNAQNDMFLTDNVYDRNQYNLSVPPDNPTIQVQPGTTMKGRFVFIGRLAPQASKLSLSMNYKSYSDRNPSRPYLYFNDILVQRHIQK